MNMALTETVDSIVKNLREGRYPNEQSISQGIVLRVLSDLGWDQWNPDQVWPEFAVGGRRVDFALCFPVRKPMIFVEVKQPGKGDGADQQLFEYAFHEGVPMALLCDGRSWGFYLPGEQGSYEERRVHHLDLFERPSAEAAEKLYTYLAYQRVVSGDAIEQARRDYRDQNRRLTGKRTLPEAWKTLVEDEDTTMVERLSAEVEAKCGVRPEIDDVTQFLGGLKNVGYAAASNRTVQISSPLPPSNKPSGPVGFLLRGKWYECHTAKDVMIGLLKELASQDSNFCEACYRHEDNRGRSRTYISQNRFELYQRKDAEFAEKHSEEFTPCWFVTTNLSNDAKRNVIKMASRIAGLTPDVDITYTLE